MTDYVVFVAEPEYISQVIDIEVKNEDNINTIKRKIQANCRPDYDLTPIDCILLFESTDSAEPLHALTKWNTDVTWGKPETPLIVRVQPSAIAPGNNNSEGCTVRSFSGNDFMNNSSKISSVVHHRESENNQNNDEQRGQRDPDVSTSIWYDLEVPYADNRVQTYTGKVILTTNEEIYIHDIRTEVKKCCEHTLRNVDAPLLQVFSGKQIDEELNPKTIWNRILHGGGRSDRLIVKLPLPVIAREGTGTGEEILLQLRLNNGTYFSKLSDVFTFGNESFENHESFVRHRHVADEYEKTVLAAKNDKLNAAEISNRSQSQRTSQKVDIFGLRSVRAQSAHLLPNAHPCASFWFSVVPMVLNTGNSNLTWIFLQKCIHGSIQNETKGFVRRIFSALTGTRGRDDVTKISTQRKNSSRISDRSSQSRISHVGIQDFSTNQIILMDQKTYFDNYPCVIIVPVMSIEEVRSWNGDGYDAIVLAGDWEQEYIDAATVYKDIGASHNMLQGTNLVESCLASEEQCMAACHLLKQMILSVCDTAKGSSQLHVDLSKNEKFDEWNGYVSLLNDAPVPIISRWRNGNDVMKVRKVAFSASNPAPDPVLLLAKAASNWLKRHQIAILPTCEDTDTNSSNCSDSFVSIGSEEDKVRGWSHIFTTAKKPRIGEVDICVNRDVVDEPLSDDESLGKIVQK